MILKINCERGIHVYYVAYISGYQESKSEAEWINK